MRQRIKKIAKRALVTGGSFGTAITAMSMVGNCGSCADAGIEGVGVLILLWALAMAAGVVVSFVLFFLTSFKGEE